MKTQKSVYLLALAVLAGTSVTAAPFLAINDNSEVFLTGGVGVRSDSNIFLSHSAPTGQSKSDTIFNFDVGAELKYGTQSALNGVLSVNDTFNRYSDHSKLNNNLADAHFSSNYDDQKLKFGFTVNYAELNDNQFEPSSTLLVRDYLVRRNVFDTGLNGEVSVSEKTSFGLGGSFAHTDYRRAGYADSDVLTMPLNYYLQVTPKVDLSLGYRYRNTSVSIGQDSRDDYYNVGTRGQFTPKLSGTLSVGLNRRNVGGTTQDQLGVDSDLSYAYTPKTTVNFGVSNDFGTSGQGVQQKNLDFNGSIQTIISDQWTLRASGSFRNIQYANTALPPSDNSRTDHYYEGQLGAIYTVNAYVRITAAYSHRENHNNKNVLPAEFTGDVFSLAANFRY